MESKTDRALLAIQENSLDFDEYLSLSEFRDIYHRLKQQVEEEKLFWIVVLVEEQILIQLSGKQAVLLNVKDEPCKFYSKKDLDFLSPSDSVLLGSIYGKHSFSKFFNSTIGLKGIIVFSLALLAIWFIFYTYATDPVMDKISYWLITAMSIFVSIFVLFVLNTETKYYQGFFESGRLHKLVQSDKIICSISITALLLSIGSQIFTNAYKSTPLLIWEVLDWVRLLETLLLSFSVMSFLLSFWLLINYHFARRNELFQLIMAKEALSKHQFQYQESIKQRTE